MESNEYEDLAFEIERMYRVQVGVLPVVIGALGVVTKTLKASLEKLGFVHTLGCIQMAII